MTVEEGLAILEATTDQLLEWTSKIGEWGTQGPPADPDDTQTFHQPAASWTNGWWSGARRVDAHPGRVGGSIRPWATVVHTTDMPAETFSALLKQWTSSPGEGACAHFIIGRTPVDGVVQLAPILRNGNHAGGPGHGVFDTASTKSIHPNLVCVGIEVHCAGGVRKINGSWRFVEDGVAHGLPIPDAEVTIDPQRPGRGWHRLTDYQLAALDSLLLELESVLQPMPDGAATRAFGETPDAFTVMPTARVVTHAQLDPVHRADPWRPTCDWLKSRASK